MPISIIESIIKSTTRSLTPLQRCFALVLFIALALFGQAATALQTGDRFKDWTVRCEKPAEDAPEACFIYQTLVNEKQEPVLQMVVGYLGRNAQPVVVFTAPLGVALRAGVGVKVDQADMFNLPYERCGPQGCIAGGPLSDQHILAFKNGVKSQIVLHDGRQPVSLEISLSGFTAGFNALR